MTRPDRAGGGRTYDVRVDRDVRIPTRGHGVTLSADVYRPVSDDPVPALVTVSPSRKDTMDQAGDLRRWFTRHGYAGLLVDLRGTGLSDGVARPMYDPDEADDALAAIEWVAAQPWCDGNVGMWGFSSGATLTLRAAARRSPHLKAIMPIMGMLDPERDFVHPAGVRGGLMSVAQWGCFNLINQLQPSVNNPTGHDEHRRWLRRLEAEPALVDFFRHAPGDAVWRARAVDAASITVPTLCVAGWNELHCDGTVRAFEEITGPKWLLAGPWGHFVPHRSPVAPIDFPALATEWWDRWLKGTDNRAAALAPVTAYVQDESPGWRAFDGWPDRGGKVLAMTPTGAAGPPPPVAVYQPDPTIGTLTGWWGAFMDPLRLDQHDDDLRSARAETVLESAVSLVGRPEVSLRFAPDEAGDVHVPERLVVRLAVVDDEGRSTLVTEGIKRLAPEDRHPTVVMWPTAYHLGAGRRLRISVSDAGFPRLWPADGHRPVLVSDVELTLPTTPADRAAAPLPPPLPVDEPAAKPRSWSEPRWAITRHPASDRVEVTTGDVHTTGTSGGHFHLRETAFTAAVSRAAPEAAVISGSHRAETRMPTGETVVARVEVRMTRAALYVNGTVTIDDMTVFTRTWTA